jgi:replicative DNA helicase
MKQDKPQPQAVEVEEAVISTILLYPDSINNVMGILTPDMFYKSLHESIYQCCIDMIQRSGAKVDLFTVQDELRKKKIPFNETELTEISGRIITDKRIEDHALIIKEKYLLRRYIQASNELLDIAQSEDLTKVVEKAETDLLNIAGLIHTSGPVKLADVVEDSIKTIDKIIRKEISLTGVPSGFTQFDRQTGGFENGELIIIAARPSIGKTALGLQVAFNTSGLGYPVLIFSCEMSKTDISYRYLSGVSDYSNAELKSGRVNLDKVLKTSEVLLEHNIYIDDTSAISLIELRAKTRKMILKHSVKMIIVDYLQLMKGMGENRLQEVSYLSRGLKALAKDLSIPVVVMSQLNRNAEGRADKRPHLSELRESGTIEQDADIVMLLWRPAHYGIETVEVCGSNRDTKNLIVVDIAKNRNGPTGELMLFHNEFITVINE